MKILDPIIEAMGLRLPTVEELNKAGEAMNTDEDIDTSWLNSESNRPFLPIIKKD